MCVLLCSHLYEDSARGGDLAEQLSPLIFSKKLFFKSMFACELQLIKDKDLIKSSSIQETSLFTDLFLPERFLVLSSDAPLLSDHGEGFLLGLLSVCGAAMGVQLLPLGAKLVSAFSAFLCMP